MQKIRNFSFLLAMVLVFSSCTKDVLRGKGDQVTETRGLGVFSVVHFSGVREAQIIKSTEYKVELSGYSNLLDHFQAITSNGNLSFYFTDYNNIKNDNIKLKIYTPTLEKIYQSGETKVKVGEGFAWNAFGVYQAGLSHLEIAGGTANLFTVESSGESKIFARPLIAERVSLSGSGESYAEVFATGFLEANASGKSRVKYWGEPTATLISTTGNARVEAQ